MLAQSALPPAPVDDADEAAFDVLELELELAALAVAVAPEPCVVLLPQPAGATADAANAAPIAIQAYFMGATIVARVPIARKNRAIAPQREPRLEFTARKRPSGGLPWTARTSGGIGRRTGLRIRRRKA